MLKVLGKILSSGSASSDLAKKSQNTQEWILVFKKYYYFFVKYLSLIMKYFLLIFIL